MHRRGSVGRGFAERAIPGGSSHAPDSVPVREHLPWLYSSIAFGAAKTYLFPRKGPGKHRIALAVAIPLARQPPRRSRPRPARRRPTRRRALIAVKSRANDPIRSGPGPPAAPSPTIVRRAPIPMAMSSIVATGTINATRTISRTTAPEPRRMPWKSSGGPTLLLVILAIGGVGLLGFCLVGFLFFVGFAASGSSASAGLPAGLNNTPIIVGPQPAGNLLLPAGDVPLRNTISADANGVWGAGIQPRRQPPWRLPPAATWDGQASSAFSRRRAGPPRGTAQHPTRTCSAWRIGGMATRSPSPPAMRAC